MNVRNWLRGQGWKPRAVSWGWAIDSKATNCEQKPHGEDAVEDEKTSLPFLSYSLLVQTFHPLEITQITLTNWMSPWISGLQLACPFRMVVASSESPSARRIWGTKRKSERIQHASVDLLRYLLHAHRNLPFYCGREYFPFHLQSRHCAHSCRIYVTSFHARNPSAQRTVELLDRSAPAHPAPLAQFWKVGWLRRRAICQNSLLYSSSALDYTFLGPYEFYELPS